MVRVKIKQVSRLKREGRLERVSRRASGRGAFGEQTGGLRRVEGRVNQVTKTCRYFLCGCAVRSRGKAGLPLGLLLIRLRLGFRLASDLAFV